MALINRVARLFKADFHAVLDQIEEPEQMLRQAIRDMEDDLAVTEQRIAACRQDSEVLSRRKIELENALAGFEEQIDLCFEQDKEELAKKLIRKKLETAQLLRHLEARFAAGRRFLADQETVLDENRTTLNGLRQKAELIAQRAPGHPAGGTESGEPGWMARELAVGDDEVEVAFLRAKSLRGAS